MGKEIVKNTELITPENITAEVDLKKGKLVRVDCESYVIEYELPENYCVGTKD